eukprot:jgi/Mesvir1/1816/Mv07781-RA.1
MGDVLKNLGTCKARKLYANELWSGDGLTDAKNVLLVGHTNVDLLPNKENNSAIGAVSQINKSTHRVNVHGDLAVHGDLVNNGRITTTSTGLEVAPARGAVRLAGYTDIDMVPNRENGSDVGSISQVNKATHRVNVHGDLAVHDDLLASDVKSLGSTLRLSGTSDVAVDSDLVVTATGGGKGVISSSVGDIELRPASGTVKVVGNVEIAGLVSSVTINAVTNEVEDTTLSLANPAHALVAHWPFDGDSLVDVAGSAIAMTVEGGAILGGQFKTSVDGVGTASVANAAFPSVTESFDVGFNVTFVDGLPISGRGVARGADPVIGAFLFATNVPYAFRIVREYDAVDPHLSTVKVYVNNVIRASATGGTSLAVTAIPSLPSLVLGDVQDLGLGHEPTFLSNHGPGEFDDQTDRVWKSKFDTATTASYVSASHASMKYRGGRNHAVATVTVKPKTSLGACTGAGYPFARNTSVATIAASPSGTLELFAFGSLSTPGEHVRVWVFKGGALLASNGLVYAETSSPVVASREFQLGVGIGVSGTDGAVVLYVNGVPQTLSAAKLLSDESAGAQTWDVTLGLTETVAVRLGSPAYGSGEKPIDVWYKNLRLVDTNHASFQGITLDAYYMSALAAIILFHTYTSHTYLKKVTRCRSTDWRCWWTQYGMFSVGLVSAAGLAYLAWKDSRTGLGSPTPIASALQLVGGGRAA